MKNSTLKFCAMLLAICTSTIHLQAMDEWDGVTVAKGFYSGTGTEADPYRIFTASQFLYFIQQTRDGNTFNGQYIELCNDIAFKSNEGLVEGGDFYGDFDGNDHTIQVNKYWERYDDYIWGGWHLFNLYGSMHNVLFVRANEAMTIYTGGILYNCRFEFPGGSGYMAGYHGNYTVCLSGGTIANCVSNSASFQQRLEMHPSNGFVDSYYTPHGYCLNCYFPITSKGYGGDLAPNYNGVIESCGEEAGNDWVLNHTEYAYKSWPLTFNPTFPEYQIQEQPQPYNPSVLFPYSDEALYQWCYQASKPITFEDIKGNATQTKTIEASTDGAILSFDFQAHGYTYTGYNDGTDKPAWIRINGEDIVYVYKEVEGRYSSIVSSGTYEISCTRSDISNIRLTYPTETVANETSSILSKQTIMEKSGIYFCQVSYGEGCDVMNSDYVDYEKLLTIDNVTYVINEDATATVLWADDMAERVTIHETVSYDDVDYPVTSISSKAFADCSSLASIKCKAFNVPALLGGTTFEGLIPSNLTLYVAAEALESYKTTAPWNGFGNIAAIPKDVTITMNQYGNGTYSSVFALDFSEVKGLKAYAATGYNSGTGVVTLTRVMTTQPETGLFLKGEPGTYEIPVIETSLDHTINMLVATLTKTTVNSTSDDGKYLNYKYTVVAAESPLPMFYQFEDGSSLSASKAYLQIPAAWIPETEQKSISIRFDEGEGATDIEEAEIRNQKSEMVYDLMGRKVSVPQKGGVYIVNGKKVVIK